MDATAVQQLFKRSNGSYLCARWGRPIVPVVFGVDDATLRVVKGAIEAVVTLAGHKMAETDPELGANLMMFFFREWDELRNVPNLDRLVPDLGALVTKLESGDANQYRAFRFDADGAIKAAFVFVRMDSHLSELPAETLALSQAAQVILLWGDAAFSKMSPLAKLKDVLVLRPEIAAIIKTAYDPILPTVAHDASHAMRLAARLSLLSQGLHS